MRKKTQKRDGAAVDRWLLFSVFFLLGIGIIMVYSAGSAVSDNLHGTPSFFAWRQVIFALAGTFFLLVLRQVNYRWLAALAVPILILAYVLLLSVFSPLGVKVGGATRWIDLGLLNFQPSEYARFAFIVYLSFFMSRNPESMDRWWPGILWPLILTGAMVGIFMVQPDFGSSVLLCATVGIMLFVGGARIAHLAMLAATAAPLAVAAVIFAPYRLARLLTYIHPERDPLGAGYHINHSLMAFGSGGVWGAGFGDGIQKLHYLPAPHTDFIFAVLGEEVGLWGVCVVIGLFGVIIWRGLRLARHVDDPFASFLAFGMVGAIGLSAVVNMGVTMGLLPTKGLTLPFISYGGSSLVFNLIYVGVLCSIARVHGVPPSAAEVRKEEKAALQARRATAEGGATA
ncbi:MAG: putative lipid II flippase FtsW [Pseudomonadota bacterium]